MVHLALPRMRIHNNSSILQDHQTLRPDEIFGSNDEAPSGTKSVAAIPPLTRLLGSFELQTERTPPEPRVEPRGLGRHDEDRSREYNHRRTIRERRWVPTAPHPRPTKLPPPRSSSQKKETRVQNQNVSVPRDRPADRPPTIHPSPRTGGHPHFRGDGTRERGACPAPSRPVRPPTPRSPLPPS